MAEFTKERLMALSNPENVGPILSDEIVEMASQLLASMEREPVACIDRANMDYLESGAGADVWPASEADSDDVLLYAAPQLPQPAVVVSEAQSKKLFDEWSGGDGALGELRASGVPDEFISMLKEFSLATWEACREAMLKHSAPFIVTSDHRMMEMPKVEGIDAVADMLQGAEPVQGWIPCSERMPEEIGRYWCYVEEQNSLGKSHYQWNCSWNGDRWWVESENGGRVTHWMPLPAAPQQEAVTDNTTQQFESLGLVVTSDERKMEIPRCSKHPEIDLQVHPFEQLMSYPPQPVMYCPLCRPSVAKWVEFDKQLRQRKEVK